MIPLRVYVEGFMSYRDGAELLFDGASLWALSGDNGAGKSAIFDAITFVLYGRHRGGKQNAEALINQQADNLVAEFDFAFGSDVYRVKRTLTRKGRTSYQVFHLKEPKIPQSGKPSPYPEPMTHTKDSFDNWVSSTLGLDDKTFTASVLLQQGKSEVMLEADPRIRHEMLSQIVDLSAYKRLHEKAEELYKNFRDEAKTFQNQLQELKPVDEAEIKRLADEIKEEIRKAQEAQKQLEILAALKVHAKNWGKLIDEQKKIEQALKEDRILFAQAKQIERDAERRAELKQVLPLLKYLFEERQRLIKSDELIEKNETEAKRWIIKLKKAESDLTKAQENSEQLKEQQEYWQQQKSEAQTTLVELAPRIEELKQLNSTRLEFDQLTQKLRVFPTDLDEQILYLEREVELLVELKTAIPWLQQFAQAKVAWQEAKLREKEAKAKILELTEHLSEMSSKQIKVQEELKEVKTQVNKLQQKFTEAKTLSSESKKRLERFEKIERLPNCDYCGQPLTLEHLEAERKRLEDEYQQAKNKACKAEEEHSKAVGQQHSLVQEAEELAIQAQKLEADKQNTAQKLKNAQRDQTQAVNQAQIALKALPQTYQILINPSATIDIATCFAIEYPTQFEMDALDQQTTRHDTQKQELEKLRRLATQRNTLLAQCKSAENRLRSLEEKYPNQQIQEVSRAQQAAEEKQKSADQELAKLNEPLRQAEQACREANEALKQAEEQERQATNNTQTEKVRQQELKRNITNEEGKLPEVWRTTTISLTKEQLELWQAEIESLADADKYLNQLNEAKREHESREYHLSRLQQQLTEIPPEARCLIAELEQKEHAERQKQAKADEVRGQAEREKQALEERHKHRCDLETKRRQAAYKAELYKELAHLLGPDYLQRYLLQHAEASIVANANEALDRISSGTLRLELQRSKETGNGKGTDKAATKALDIVAHNSITGEKPIPVAFLSGSQRFRVAVSLALGIGRYAGQESRRIESVIIDEGFGGLDREGRREIIEELHRLKNVLGRIIIVSHQEEFANAFPNRYEIKIVNGTSQIERV